MQSSLYCIWHSRVHAGTKEMAKGVLIRRRRLLSPGWPQNWAEVAGPMHCVSIGVYALQMVR